MKKIVVLIVCTLLLSCGKNKEIVFDYNVDNMEVTETEMYMECSYSVEGELEKICLLYGKSMDLSDASRKEIVFSDGYFEVTLTALEENTQYYYCFECSNDDNSVRTEIDSFTTNEGHDDTSLLVTVGDVTFKMIEVVGETFYMGAQSSNPNDPNYVQGSNQLENPVHQVSLNDYYIGETEVTQELWVAVMGNNPSYAQADNNPVDNVSWSDCQTFIAKLNQMTSMTFRLPTEAEWEYAARGGMYSMGYKYAGDDDINTVAVYGDLNLTGSAHAVKTKTANELGLYDMSGNVYEWCQDWFGFYSSSKQENPTGPSTGDYKITRGGSWNRASDYCRVSFRDAQLPNQKGANYGLRVVLDK